MSGEKSSIGEKPYLRVYLPRYETNSRTNFSKIDEHTPETTSKKKIKEKKNRENQHRYSKPTTNSYYQCISVKNNQYYNNLQNEKTKHIDSWQPSNVYSPQQNTYSPQHSIEKERTWSRPSKYTEDDGSTTQYLPKLRYTTMQPYPEGKQEAMNPSVPKSFPTHHSGFYSISDEYNTYRPDFHPLSKPLAELLQKTDPIIDIFNRTSSNGETVLTPYEYENKINVLQTHLCTLNNFLKAYRNINIPVELENQLLEQQDTIIHLQKWVSLFFSHLKQIDPRYYNSKEFDLYGAMKCFFHVFSPDDKFVLTELINQNYDYSNYLTKEDVYNHFATMDDVSKWEEVLENIPVCKHEFQQSWWLINQEFVHQNQPPHYLIPTHDYLSGGQQNDKENLNNYTQPVNIMWQELHTVRLQLIASMEIIHRYSQIIQCQKRQIETQTKAMEDYKFVRVNWCDVSKYKHLSQCFYELQRSFNDLNYEAYCLRTRNHELDEQLKNEEAKTFNLLLDNMAWKQFASNLENEIEQCKNREILDKVLIRKMEIREVARQKFVYKKKYESTLKNERIKKLRENLSDCENRIKERKSEYETMKRDYEQQKEDSLVSYNSQKTYAIRKYKFITKKNERLEKVIGLYKDFNKKQKRLQIKLILKRRKSRKIIRNLNVFNCQLIEENKILKKTSKTVTNQLNEKKNIIQVLKSENKTLKKRVVPDKVHVTKDNSDIYVKLNGVLKEENDMLKKNTVMMNNDLISQSKLVDELNSKNKFLLKQLEELRRNIQTTNKNTKKSEIKDSLEGKMSNDKNNVFTDEQIKQFLPNERDLINEISNLTIVSGMALAKNDLYERERVQFMLDIQYKEKIIYSFQSELKRARDELQETRKELCDTRKELHDLTNKKLEELLQTVTNNINVGESNPSSVQLNIDVPDVKDDVPDVKDDVPDVKDDVPDVKDEVPDDKKTKTENTLHEGIITCPSKITPLEETILLSQQLFCCEDLSVYDPKVDNSISHLKDDSTNIKETTEGGSPKENNSTEGGSGELTLEGSVITEISTEGGSPKENISDIKNPITENQISDTTKKETFLIEEGDERENYEDFYIKELFDGDIPEHDLILSRAIEEERKSRDEEVPCDFIVIDPKVLQKKMSLSTREKDATNSYWSTLFGEVRNHIHNDTPTKSGQFCSEGCNHFPSQSQNGNQTQKRKESKGQKNSDKKVLAAMACQISEARKEWIQMDGCHVLYNTFNLYTEYPEIINLLQEMHDTLHSNPHMQTVPLPTTKDFQQHVNSTLFHILITYHVDCIQMLRFLEWQKQFILKKFVISAIQIKEPKFDIIQTLTQEMGGSDAKKVDAIFTGLWKQQLKIVYPKMEVEEPYFVPNLAFPKIPEFKLSYINKNISQYVIRNVFIMVNKFEVLQEIRANLKIHLKNCLLYNAIRLNGETLDHLLEQIYHFVVFTIHEDNTDLNSLESSFVGDTTKENRCFTSCYWTVYISILGNIHVGEHKIPFSYQIPNKFITQQINTLRNYCSNQIKGVFNFWQDIHLINFTLCPNWNTLCLTSGKEYLFINNESHFFKK